MRRRRIRTDNSYLTLHYFWPDKIEILGTEGCTPQNANIWEPDNDRDRWPPRSIFNYVYARAVFKWWKVKRDSVYTAKVKSLYDRIANVAAEEQQRRAKEREAKRKLNNQNCVERAKRMRRQDGDEVNGDSDDDDENNDYNTVYSMEDELSAFDEFQLFMWKRQSRKKSIPYIANDARDKIETWRQGVKGSEDDIPATHLTE